MILDFDKAWKNMNYLHLLESANSLHGFVRFSIDFVWGAEMFTHFF